eukprot:5071636-Prymnesium_polylepis.2
MISDVLLYVPRCRVWEFARQLLARAMFVGPSYRAQRPRVESARPLRLAHGRAGRAGSQEGLKGVQGVTTRVTRWFTGGSQGDASSCAAAPSTRTLRARPIPSIASAAGRSRTPGRRFASRAPRAARGTRASAVRGPPPTARRATRAPLTFRRTTSSARV